MPRIFLFASVFAAVLISATTTSAQVSLNYLCCADLKKSYATTSEPSSPYLNEHNTNAMRHFMTTYGENVNENWSTKSDGYRASFKKDGVTYLVDYNKKGNWNSTIRIYNQAQLPKDIRRIVRSSYYDYNIVSVSELTIGKTVAYFVKIQDEVSLKTVRVMDNDMAVIEDYRRGDR